jgi:ferredoxin
VISIGIRIGEGVREANKIAYGGLRHSIYIYERFGYTLLNEELDRVSNHIARVLEKKGHIATPVPASSPSDAYALRGVFSNRHAAVAAGLGEFGWNTLLVTPDNGPRVRLASVITDAQLDPDPMYEKKRICNREQCNICVSVCPMNAISKDRSVKVKIGDRTFEYARIDKMRCRFGTAALSSKTLGRTDFEIPPNPSHEDYLKILSKEDPWQKMEKDGSMCGRCIINCPIPIRGSAGRKTLLSSPPRLKP